MDRNDNAFPAAGLRENMMTAFDADENPSTPLQDPDKFLPGDLFQIASSRIWSSPCDSSAFAASNHSSIASFK